MFYITWLRSIYRRLFGRGCTIRKHKWKFQAHSPDSGKVFFCERCGMLVGSRAGFMGFKSPAS